MIGNLLGEITFSKRLFKLYDLNIMIKHFPQQYYSFENVISTNEFLNNCKLL